MKATRGSMAAALLLLLLATATGARLGELARRDPGDVFTLLGDECGPTQCAEHGAGASTDSGTCVCACPQRAPLFREDRELCVDDLPECSLATFGTGSTLQRIPFVYLPLKGQIIHPSKEITFQNVKTPICAVSDAQFLTRKGFLDLRNTIDADVPFNLFRDEGRTFLQWSGEDEMRTRMSGRVMVVRLLCRDVTATPTSPLDLRGVFTPCVAFRVQGSPPKSNVTEVQFASNAQTSEATPTTGLTVTEYVAIGISSLLLGLIYVASVFLYLHIRKRRKAASDEGSTKRLKGLKKKDGSVITERDIIRVNSVQPLPNAMGQDDGVVKKNPLLSITRQFHESKSFPSDSGSNLSDSDDFAENSVRSDDVNLYNNQITSALVHLHRGVQDCSELIHRDEGIERLPDEHVSIVETIDDREIARPVGTTRRKLYFNPAYFEPHLMAEPPAAALEFLVKIREVIAIAKHKMAAKRFQPILNEIPEEETYMSNANSVDIYQGLGSQRSGSVVSLKRENSRKKNVSCVGCPGCKSDNETDVQNYIKFNMSACSNCLHHKGDKQSSIRQWLENIPTEKQQPEYNEFLNNVNSNNFANSLSLSNNESRHKIKKQNSFTASNSINTRDLLPNSRKSSTMSVRSEPPLRNYNLPLPEFNNIDCQPENFNNLYCQTVSRVDDIRPIGLSDYRPGSLRNSLTYRQNRMMSHKNALPDMVHDAMALDRCLKTYNQSSSDEEKLGKSIDKEDVYTRNNSESPSGNEYETDSLERNSNQKRITTPCEYPDVPSSQASPSLSNALPLEEELTMRNAVYKTLSSSNSETPSPRQILIEPNHYETIGKKNQTVVKEKATTNEKTDYSLVSEVYVNNNYNFGSTPTSPSGSESSLGSRKMKPKNAQEKPGCLTIEVKDPPENYIKIHESDGFEPDTLDRKHLKHKEIIETMQFSRKDLIKSINIEPSPPSQRIQLRSSGTFTKTNNKVEYTAKFHSLRNDFEQRKITNDRPKLLPTTFKTKTYENTTEDTWENDPSDWNSEEGRILTLEIRHSKRQRQCTPPTIKQIKNLARPDILPPLPPPDDSPIYEQPIVPPRKVEIDKISVPKTHQKNSNDRSLSPRTLRKSTTVESTLCNSIHRETQHGPSCGPMRASGQLQSSEYEYSKSLTQRSNDFNRNSSRIPSFRNINTHTFVKDKEDNHSRSRIRRKKGPSVEDSGYLSSDSTGSRQIIRKGTIPKIVSCSESDDTENEARSESGAESVETHSVYFGSFRKPQVSIDNEHIVDPKSERTITRKFKYSNKKDCL